MPARAAKIIYLVRHGEIAGGGEKRFIGQTDTPLSPVGVGQAERLRARLGKVEFAAVYCSDLARSVATAGIICEKRSVKPIIMKELREIDLGLWDGLSFSEVKALYPGEFGRRGADIVNYTPPAGESFAACAQRVNEVLDSVLKEHSGKVLIVGHAGINSVITCRALGRPLEDLFSARQDYGCLSVLRF
jgi:probable phosphoglycerate mutase